MPNHYFTDEQEAELEEHFRASFPDDAAVEDAIATIDYACALAECDLTWPAENKRLILAHFLAVLTHATELQTLLRGRRPLVSAVDWAALDKLLAGTIESAGIEISRRKMPGRGRPPKEWRDRLISAVQSTYPPGLVRKTSGSHFEQTIEILLGFLGQEIADVHAVVLDALRRVPTPGFSVTKIRPSKRVP